MVKIISIRLPSVHPVPRGLQRQKTGVSSLVIPKPVGPHLRNLLQTLLKEVSLLAEIDPAVLMFVHHRFVSRCCTATTTIHQ